MKFVMYIFVCMAGTGLLDLPASGQNAAPATLPATSRPCEAQRDGFTTRTPADVEALIAQAGKTKPAWYDAVELTYPKTLDLTWSNQRTPGWEPQKKLGAYMFSVIGANPSRYREGVRLLHYVVIVNKDNASRLGQSMNALGSAYYELLEDWPRAVFWWRAADKVSPGRFSHTLQDARCYYKMGSTQMAADLIGRLDQDTTRHGGVARLWSEMGEFDKALALAEQIARRGRPDVGYLVAGDVSRRMGQFKEAMGYYQKVVDTAQTVGRDLKRNKQRAQRNLDAIRVLDALDLSKVKDGIYSGSAVGYIGDVQVALTIGKGRIESLRVVQSRDDRPLSTLTEMPARILAKQGIKGVDSVSGATVTSDAVINATGEALQEATR